MFNLTDKNISYLLISPEKGSNSIEENKILCDKLYTLLYSRNYIVIPITGYYDGITENSFIAIQGDSGELRSDAIYLIEEFNQDSIIVKYKNETSAKKIFNDGSEGLLEISVYESEAKGKTYIYNGVSFSFSDQKRYQLISDKAQLKRGMVIEFFNNDKWIQKKVDNIDDEYEKMYKLLMRYNKLRMCTENLDPNDVFNQEDIEYCALELTDLPYNFKIEWIKVDEPHQMPNRPIGVPPFNEDKKCQIKWVGEIIGASMNINCTGKWINNEIVIEGVQQYSYGDRQFIDVDFKISDPMCDEQKILSKILTPLKSAVNKIYLNIIRDNVQNIHLEDDIEFIINCYSVQRGTCIVILLSIQ